MKLLVTQLQNQNPLEPMDNNQMASQLAQLSQLGQIESLNSKFADVLSTMQRSYAGSLVGKQISFIAENENGDAGLASGTVTEVVNNGDEINLRIGDLNYAVKLSDVISVKG
jgi:flagellar basal-body rod modification protein FlgD